MPSPTGSLSMRQSLVLPTIALTYTLGATLPIGHRETTYVAMPESVLEGLCIRTLQPLS